MSNIYIQEPPALGKVVLKTTVGDIDIELWTKETPKACRNFIQLCMEGYYNGTIFHRLVPDFIVQGGDPNGDGTGGESIYGAPFKDEFHSRLRFNRRGLVAMANAGKDDNGSQFFFTLNTTPELQNKHTIFGKVTGETIFNMLKLAEGLTDADDRPMYPHKIVSAEILLNPFEDIVPRVLPKESKTDKDAAKEKKKKDRVAVKNFGLLSFGDEAEEDEGEAVEYRGKPKSTHDLLDDPKLSKQTAAELNLDDDENENNSVSINKRSEAETQAAVNSIKEKLQAKKSGKDKVAEKPQAEENGESSGEEYYLGKEKADQRRKETEKIRDEIKQMKKDMKSKLIEDKGKGDSISDDGKTPKSDNEMYEQYISEQEKYKKLKEAIPKKGAARESFTLELLAKFQKKLLAAKEKQNQRKDSENDDTSGPKQEKEKQETDDNLEDDEDWLAHELHFEEKGAVLAKDASTKGDDWFDIYDPRNPLNKRKREEGGKNKNKMKKTDKI